MQRRAILAALAPLLALLVSGVDGAERRPNVLLIISDDQRFDTIRALGNEEIETPNLDRLVRNGFALTHTFCMGSTVPAVCMPSRSMLLTGRTLWRSPVQIPPELPMIPQVFGAAGYTTFGIGKWHNGPPAYARAFHDGDKVFLGGMHDHNAIPVSSFDSSGKYSKKLRKIASGHSTDVFADAAIKFLRGHKGEEPFFLYVAFTAPHDPRTPPEEFAMKYDPKAMAVPESFLPQHPFNNGEMLVRDEKLAPWPRTEPTIQQQTADYYAMITHLDARVGDILQTLERTGQGENTLIVFTSDNGLAVGRHGLLGKQNLYDHSVRVPLVLAGPGVPRGKRSDALCYLFDLFPTLCSLAGVEAPETIEGRDLTPVIRGDADQVRGSIFGAYGEVQRMVRTADWKLIRYPQINRTQLFDLQRDPHEIKDLAGSAEHKERIQELTVLLEQQQSEHGDHLPLTSSTPAPEQVELR